MSTTRVSTLQPMLCTAGKLPAGEGWGFEIKWDGARAIATVTAGELTLRSRNNHVITASYPELQGIPNVVARDCTLDGELLCLDAQGRPSLRLLQQRLGRSRPGPGLAPVSYYIFDLLALDGKPLTGRTYRQRREQLDSLGFDGGGLVLTPWYVGDGGSVLEVAAGMGLEGVVAKRLDSRYQPGRRSRDWVKMKLRCRQEFVVGAVEGGRGSRAGKLGALHLGVHDEHGQLTYVGAVGSGFDGQDLAQISELLVPLASHTNPFTDWDCPKHVICLKPELVVDVEFLRFTDDGILREPVYKGLRPDIPAAGVRREPVEPAR